MRDMTRQEFVRYLSQRHVLTSMAPQADIVSSLTQFIKCSMSELCACGRRFDHEKPCACWCHDVTQLEQAVAEIEELRAICNDLHHDATCHESFCRLCGEGITEWEARRVCATESAPVALQLMHEEDRRG